MLREVFVERIRSTVTMCNQHKRYLIFSKEQMADIFPLSPVRFETISEGQVAMLDQMLFRFSKLQDVIGKRLIKEILEYLGEDIESLPFIDRLLILEKLEIFPSADEWLAFRELRNVVSHEYPENAEKIVHGLNELYIAAGRIIEIYNGMVEYLGRTIYPLP